MIAFPGMLVAAAEKAGMKIPPNPDNYFDVANEFPHFAVFCNAQLGRPMNPMSVHWDNAKVIAKIPLNKIKTITLKELEKRGFR